MGKRFSFYSRRFLAWARKSLHPTTVAVYEHYFRRFVQECGDRTIRRITPALLQSWATTWHQCQAIRRLFKWAVEDARLLKESPVARVVHPPKGQRRRIFSRHESLAVLRQVRPAFRALLLGYRETWARPGELRAATWADLHPFETAEQLRKALLAGEAMIVLHEYKNRKRRRLPNEPRVILLSPRVGRLLVRLLGRGPSRTDPIFVTEKGRPWTAQALRCRMRRVRAALGLVRDRRGENLVPYTFRHTGGTLATACGVRDRTLADALGHVETQTTKRYQHLDVSDVRKALRAVWQRLRTDRAD